jgi:hypothetical protein
MTKQQKYMKRKYAEGWKQLGGMLPPDIYKQVINYKNELMTHYRQTQETQETHYENQNTDKLC